MRFGLLMVTVCALILSACGRQESGGGQPTREAAAPESSAAAAPAVEYYDDGTGIRWVNGDVEAAFALAKAENKPLFLYWGAEWCPPCHLIKATVFKKRKFVERSRLFVPVYLDGDTESAQRYGEQFAVMGYPTVVVFDPDGTEIIRISSGITIDAYADVLDVTMSTMRPVKEIANATLAGAPPSARECTLLAYYSWEQDNETILADLDRVNLYRTMLDQCQGDQAEEASRLYILYLQEIMAGADPGEDSETEPVPLAAEQKQEAVARLHAILAEPALVRANVYPLLFQGAAMARAVTETGSAEREALVAAFYAAYDRLADDDKVYTNERLYTAMAKVRFERIDDEQAELSEVLKDEIRAKVAWADGITENVYERQTVMNVAWNTMSEAGLDAEANAMLMAEIGRSAEPYYFMLSLAELAERAGRSDEAIAWLKRAYEESRGRATRFQWGVNYVTGLIEMAPEDAEAIGEATLTVFGELGDNAEDAFYQRNRVRMERLEKKFLEWNADGAYADTLGSIRTGVLTICEQIPAGAESRITCESFLAAI